MTLAIATVLLLIASPFVFWPLLSRLQEATPTPPEGWGRQPDAEEDRERGVEEDELRLDVATGRLSEAEARLLREEA